MKQIEFEIDFGGKIKKVELSPVTGSNGIVHLYIDKFYYGQLVKVKDKWEAYMNKNELTGDDITAIIQIVEEAGW